MIFFTACILMVILGAQIFLRPFRVSYARALFGVALVGIALFLSYKSYLEYQKFSQSLLGYLELREGTEWFLGYIRFHIWNTYIVSFIASIIFFYIATWFNKRREGALFEKEEIWIGALCFLIVGYPGIILYLACILCIAILGSFTTQVIMKRDERFSLYMVWVPVALFGILFIQYVLRYETWWALFRF